MGLWNARIARVAVLACTLVVGVVLFGAQPALADTATITITNTAGTSDPAADLPRVFTVAGATAAPESLFIKFRATGGAPCAPSDQVDTGSILETPDGHVFNGSDQPNGSYSYAHAITWDTPGTYLFCIWLASSYSAVATPISQVITFRGPTGTLAGTLSPATPVPNQAATITVSGTSEAAESVYAAYNAAGTPCASTFSSDSYKGSFEGNDVNGAFSVTYTQSFAAGSYVLCLWLADSTSETSPIAVQSIPFTVATPAPPPPPPTTTPTPPKKKAPIVPLATHVRSIFPKVAHKLKMTVWSQVTATGQTPKGNCWLQVFLNHQWRTAGAHTPVTAKGVCQIFTRFTYAGGKRFRVSFRPATGFVQAAGSSAWVIATKR